MKNNEIKIKHGSSSLSEFVKRPLASDEEVEAFDDYVSSEAKAEEIKDSLTKIYSDDDGNRVDVRKMVIKKKRGLLFNLFSFLIVVFVMAGAVYAAYTYIYLRINNSGLSLSIDGPVESAVGEEFSYEVNYKNQDKVGANNLEIRVAYPENFIFISSSPEPEVNNNIWQFAKLDPRRSDIIKITGKLVGPLNSDNQISADLIYIPENFSSEFKKSAVFSTKLNDLGLDLAFSGNGAAMIGEENEIDFKFKVKDQNFLNTFRLSLDYPAEVQLTYPLSADLATSSPTGLKIQADGPGAWLFDNLGKNENDFKIKFKVKEKKTPQITLNFKLSQPVTDAAGQIKNYVFYENGLVFDVIKSDLNLNLIINGSPVDQGIDFGQILNYSINYENRGETPMKDVILMAVLDSDFLDWPSVSDQSNGKISGNTISWSKDEIPALAEIASNAQGVIDFSIKLKPASALDLSRAYQVKSYVKYSVAGKNAAGDYQSNIITNRINSDLNLGEQVRYFNDDNIAVGYGPIPPKAGQTTSLKVYWSISNNLHELDNLIVTTALPPNVRWDAKNQTSIGQLIYDSVNNQVSWLIGKLPAASVNATAQFNIALTPSAGDAGKILILIPGTKISGEDFVTGAAISKTLKAKTTKLEDDSLITGDGIVQ